MNGFEFFGKFVVLAIVEFLCVLLASALSNVFDGDPQEGAFFSIAMIVIVLNIYVLINM